MCRIMVFLSVAVFLLIASAPTNADLGLFEGGSHEREEVPSSVRMQLSGNETVAADACDSKTCQHHHDLSREKPHSKITTYQSVTACCIHYAKQRNMMCFVFTRMPSMYKIAAFYMGKPIGETTGSQYKMYCVTYKGNCFMLSVKLMDDMYKVCIQTKIKNHYSNHSCTKVKVLH
ncbi:hypothetical protein Ahia01_000436300 [Argonauta hians]